MEDEMDNDAKLSAAMNDLFVREGHSEGWAILVLDGSAGLMVPSGAFIGAFATTDSAYMAARCFGLMADKLGFDRSDVREFPKGQDADPSLN